MILRASAMLSPAPHQTAPAPPFARDARPRFASNGLAGVADFDLTLAGYIDTTGEWAVDPQFESVEPFGEGLAAVGDWASGEYGYIDEQGEWAITPRFSSVGWPFKGGLAYVMTREESSSLSTVESYDHQGWINASGEWVCEWGYNPDAPELNTADEDESDGGEQ